MTISLPKNQVAFSATTDNAVSVTNQTTLLVLAQQQSTTGDWLNDDDVIVNALLTSDGFDKASANRSSRVVINGESPLVIIFQAESLLADFAAASSADVVSSAKAAADAISSKGTVSVSVDLRSLDLQAENPAQWCRQFVQTLVEQNNTLHILKKDNKKATLESVQIFASEGQQVLLEQLIKEGVAIGEGTNIARQLGDLPGNICTPSFLADKAVELCQANGMSADIKGGDEIQALGMGAFWGVAKGSVEDPKLIEMNYQGGSADQQPIVLVGKGLTFDSGGISLKPGAAMDEMKYDMGGAASVFGTMSVISALKLPINVIALIGSCENMPDAAATKPGDVLTTMSGQTVEVLNTDAEGRLVLCDVLYYATQKNPKQIIDVATLTGAIIVGLGRVASGLFSNSDALAEQLAAAGEKTQDRVWRFPIWDEYQKQLKSNFADFGNIGGREAGSITAACYLANFVEKYDWAHLDIAATAWQSGAKKGATGRPVSMLSEFIMTQSAQ